jgi:alpha-galactosidase
MGDLIEVIYEYGNRFGVKWTEPEAMERDAA